VYRLACILIGLVPLSVPQAAQLAGQDTVVSKVHGVPTPLTTNVVADYAHRRFAITGKRASLQLCAPSAVDLQALRTRLTQLKVPVREITTSSRCGSVTRGKASKYPVLEILSFSGADSLGTLYVIAHLDTFHSQAERASFLRDSAWHLGSVSIDQPLEDWHP
jgi:hypothetical protein